MQYISALTATISMSSSAVYGVWLSPSLSTLQSKNSPVGRPITDEEGSWIAGLMSLAVIPAAFTESWLIEKLGRKKSLLVGGLLLLLPWFVVIFGRDIEWLYAHRFIGGMGSGMVTIACAIYIGEIAENDIRGRLGTSLILLKQVGSLIVLTAGPYVSYTWLGIIAAIPPATFVITFSFMPESPYYLMKIDDRSNAEKNLRTLSSKAVDDKFVQERLSEIEYSVKEDMENKTTFWEFVSKEEYRKTIYIMIGVKSLQQLSGIAAIDAYLQSIVELTTSSISSEMSSIIFGLVQIPAVLTTSFLVDKLGRRPLLITSALGCAIALAAEGIYFYLQDKTNIELSSLAWLPTTALALFLIMNPLGISTLAYVLLGELFPANIKGIAVSTFTLYGGLLAFTVSKFFAPMSNAWGIHSKLKEKPSLRFKRC
ncbi:hypothetical protein Trydic_g14366 [Trypoxylus dichotomus]